MMQVSRENVGHRDIFIVHLVFICTMAVHWALITEGAMNS